MVWLRDELLEQRSKIFLFCEHYIEILVTSFYFEPFMNISSKSTVISFENETYFTIIAQKQRYSNHR